MTRVANEPKDFPKGHHWGWFIGKQPIPEKLAPETTTPLLLPVCFEVSSMYKLKSENFAHKESKGHQNKSDLDLAVKEVLFQVTH